MCGIVGIVSESGCDVVPTLLSCLKKLEYRGYDSAGVVARKEGDGLKRVRVVGKVRDLEVKVKAHPISGNVGIIHTRWATHGVPNLENTHPHMSHSEIACVHNGIVENYEELGASLRASGYKFTSETDTEVVVHLVHKLYVESGNFLTAVRDAVAQLKGFYALVFINAKEPDYLIAARSGSPLVIGCGGNANYFSSDAISLLELTNKFIYLKDGDIARISKDKCEVFDKSLHHVKRKVVESDLSAPSFELGEYAHHMQKEMFAQPLVVQNTLASRQEKVEKYIRKIADKIDGLRIVACGSSYYAALVGRYWIEEFADIPCEVELASEFRYRKVASEKNKLFVALSQSGETADVLAALRKARELNYASRFAICNVDGSTLVRESDAAFITQAGVEIGVASTKAFTTQLVALFLLAINLASDKILSRVRKADLLEKVRQLPILLEQVLQLDAKIHDISKHLVAERHAFFLGRGANFPIALEGALKMKEIAYMYTEGYAAGELKHGPLALIDDQSLSIVIAPKDELFSKLSLGVSQVLARGGKLVVLTDAPESFAENHKITILPMPHVPFELTPIVYVIALQLLAYHVAVLRGNDVDQPRNLAKSVTVE